MTVFLIGMQVLSFDMIFPAFYGKFCDNFFLPFWQL